MKVGSEETIECDEGGESNNGEIEPANFSVEVAPSDGWANCGHD